MVWYSTRIHVSRVTHETRAAGASPTRILPPPTPFKFATMPVAKPIAAAAALLDQNRKPSDEEIGSWMTNLCRCATYDRIRKGIHAASKAMPEPVLPMPDPDRTPPEGEAGAPEGESAPPADAATGGAE